VGGLLYDVFPYLAKAPTDKTWVEWNIPLSACW
jgi:hypothetical protein